MRPGEVCEVRKHIIVPVPTSHVILPSSLALRPWQRHLIVASVTMNIVTVLYLLWWRLG